MECDITFEKPVLKDMEEIASYIKAVPSRTIWRRPLMVRQPYSVAVLSTGGRLHP